MNRRIAGSKLLTVLATAAVFVVFTGSLLGLRHSDAFLRISLPHAASVPAQIDTLEEGSFTFSHTFTVYGEPDRVYDALTGDISGWWDHSLSGHPKKMYIEARPGGGFYEMMDDHGDGIRHAVVTYADRGHRLTLDGPLPFTGHPIDMLTTYTLIPVGDSTRVTLTVRAEGEMQPQWPARIERNWRHFIYERFIPYWYTKEHRLNSVISTPGPL